jgi:hypothetical protein
MGNSGVGCRRGGKKVAKNQKVRLKKQPNLLYHFDHIPYFQFQVKMPVFGPGQQPQQPTVPSQQQQAGAGVPVPTPAGGTSRLLEDEEVWRERRRQQSEEVALAVERAKQRKEEEEKRYRETREVRSWRENVSHTLSLSM